ncbi:hypothetical protein [Floricoccus penangensis]|uniref:hypothetical protein n=1 Tax=Floricoccus penangensis TaxID=1859475 RepID=UPI001300F888|nr:hypothetical protein [Floricoccus penangensis]
MKDTTKLEKHLVEHPKDAQAQISLLKIKSDNIFNKIELNTKKKQERLQAIQRKRRKSE